jgi:polyisoprenoid-binding protein YceI
VSSTQTGAPPGTWSLDPVHSSVGFEISYLAGTFKGTFREASATLSVAEDGAMTMEGAAEVASVDVKDPDLSAHLQTPDFFDAEQHPQLRFRADDVRLDGDSVTARGELTMKGVTKPLSAAGTFAGALTDAFGRERVGFTLTTAVNRHDFGISWNMPLPTGQNALADDVRIVAELYFVRAD